MLIGVKIVSTEKRIYVKGNKLRSSDQTKARQSRLSKGMISLKPKPAGDVMQSLFGSS